MKKLTVIIGMCLIGLIAQAGSNAYAQPTAARGDGQPAKSHKRFDPEKVLARIQKAIEIRQAEVQVATAKGHADVAAALQTLITDLNSMATAVNGKDRAAFKAANERRKADRDALQALRKSDRGTHRNGKTPGATEL